MKTAKLATYAVLGIIAGLLFENKALRMRRKLEIKAAFLRKKLKRHCSRQTR